MSLPVDVTATQAFNELISELRDREWDLLIDEGSNAFITAVANENEKWELEVQFHDESRFTTKSRSRWIVKDNSLNRIERVIKRLNSHDGDSNGRTIWKIDKRLRSFEAITEATIVDDEGFSYFFDIVDENTNYYQSLSDTVREASSINIEYNDLNEGNSLIPQKTIKN
ncbi:MAG: hypothetical protein CMB30_03180 [Euryarchaeota archaeon]|nr:hypothetical protein [Euryarchaeota archaeon]|tara:strand:+ start:3215 stop:3721 length:507 start_codon:yes stop_codon:yes gene_type:complete